jgi:ABC-type phosphate/phosphonate transport system substrate-binding protein
MTWLLARGRSVRGSMLLLCALAGLCSLGSKQAGADTDRFHVNIGFSSRAFINAPQDDIKIAVGILTRKVARNTVGTANSKIYETTAAIEQDLRTRTIDTVALVPEDYLELSKRLPLEPLMMTATAQGHEVELLLLTRRDSPARTIKDLRNRRIAVPTKVSQYGSMYFTWLDLLAMHQGVRNSTLFFSDMVATKKPSQALMQVFFRQVDACVTTRQIFELTAELNPQVGRDLIVVANLPKLAGGIIAIRGDYPQDRKQKIRHELLTLHEDQEGKQLFVLFQLKKLIPYRPEYLQATEAFFREHRTLSRRLNPKP